MSTAISYVSEYFMALAELTMQMAPYLLVGFFFAGIMYVWFPRRKVYRYLGRPNSASVINAALIGIPLPLCSCGVIPTGISFFNSGASKGSSVSFLISTPQTGPDSIMVSYSMLGLPLAIIRPVIALFTGFLGGFLTNIFGSGPGKEDHTPADANEGEGQTDRSLSGMLRYAFVEFLEDIAKWLAIGLLLAALIDVLVPDSFFTNGITNETLAMVLILAAAIPLYVCATGSVPIAAVLMMKGLSPGTAIVFLMAGPATNAAAMTIIGKVLGRRTLAIYLFSIVAGALFFGLLVNEFLPREWFSTGASAVSGGPHNHGLLPGWIGMVSAVVLTGLIIRALAVRFFSGRDAPEEVISENNNNHGMMPDVKITVRGMNCNHCKAAVEQNVGRIPGIISAEADLSSETVVVKGTEIDIEAVRDRIEELGYEFGGKLG